MEMDRELFQPTVTPSTHCLKYGPLHGMVKLQRQEKDVKLVYLERCKSKQLKGNPSNNSFKAIKTESTAPI